MSDRAIIESINKIVGNHKTDNVTYVNATVNSVDVNARTCNVTCVEGHTEYNVTARLMACVDDGILIIPAIDSNVRIIFSRENVPFVCQYSEIENIYMTVNGKITYNHGTNTTAKADVLKTQLDIAKSRIDQIISAINSCAPSTTETGLTTIKTAVALIVISEDYSQIENTNILHG